jgi:hypothetical protein
MSAMGLSSRDAVRVGCPLYPQKLPRLSPTGAAVMGQQRTHALQQKGSSALPPRLARSPATKSSLSTACRATAAVILQKVLQIIPPIVVGNFLPRLDSAQSHDHDTAPASDWFCIRATRMIDVTCQVPSRRAVDGPSLVELELISGAACLTPIGFLGGNAPAAIGRYIDPSLDWLCRKQTEPSYRTANPK